ncbi:hypothetical protein PR048_030109 [Dryococelus australis]|uniref:Uncharacterized protein n=1 Tax=Dryococelus australis TaxID=614101 RepID=A0ABQ9GAN4_9NEOP|nr:hypothetical protein PR048_030109 [Dryococelus australis]
MTQKRLNHIAVCNIHKDISENFPLNLSEGRGFAPRCLRRGGCSVRLSHWEFVNKSVSLELRQPKASHAYVARRLEPSSRLYSIYTPFMVTTNFSETLLKLWYQDVPRPLANIDEKVTPEDQHTAFPPTPIISLTHSAGTTSRAHRREQLEGNTTGRAEILTSWRDVTRSASHHDNTTSRGGAAPAQHGDSVPVQTVRPNVSRTGGAALKHVVATHMCKSFRRSEFIPRVKRCGIRHRFDVAPQPEVRWCDVSPECLFTHATSPQSRRSAPLFTAHKLADALSQIAAVVPRRSGIA